MDRALAMALVWAVACGGGDGGAPGGRDGGGGPDPGEDGGGPDPGGDGGTDDNPEIETAESCAGIYTDWEDDYDAIFTELLAGPLSLNAITGEIDRAVEVAGDQLGGDPFSGGSPDAGGLTAWWTDRHAEVAAQVAAH
jgi:hypothetical protein